MRRMYVAMSEPAAPWVCPACNARCSDAQAAAPAMGVGVGEATGVGVALAADDVAGADEGAGVVGEGVGVDFDELEHPATKASAAASGTARARGCKRGRLAASYAFRRGIGPVCPLAVTGRESKRRGRDQRAAVGPHRRLGSTSRSRRLHHQAHPSLSEESVPPKIPRALRGPTREALADETADALAVVQTDPSDPALSAMLVTPSRLLRVGKAEARSWPMTDVAVADYQQQSTGNRAALCVLAGDELLRFLVPRGEDPTPLHEAFLALRRRHNVAVAARLSELPWWELKAVWPYAALGLVAGGTSPLVRGEKGSLGLGRRGVSIYRSGHPEPALQLPWQDVTAIFVETVDELRERLTDATALQLGLLAPGLARKGGPSFATVTTRNQELYFALEAQAEELRHHWASVLAHFAEDPVEEAAVLDTAAHSDSDLVSRLERLAALHASGVLTQAEFDAAKAAVIAGR